MTKMQGEPPSPVVRTPSLAVEMSSVGSPACTSVIGEAALAADLITQLISSISNEIWQPKRLQKLVFGRASGKIINLLSNEI